MNENETEVQKKGKNPLLLALVLIAAGALLIAVNFNSIQTVQKVYPKTFCLGMFAVFYGIALLIAPGAKRIEFESPRHCGYDLFKGADGWTRALWVLYMISSFVVSFYIIITADTWEQIYGVFAIFFAVSGLFFAIKHIALFAGYGKKEEVQEGPVPAFDYFNPSKAVCIILAVIGLGICGLSTKLYLERDILGSDYQKNKEESAFFDQLLTEHFDDKFPVHFIWEDGDTAAIVQIENPDYEEETDDSIPIINVSLRDISCEVLYTYNKRKHNKFFTSKRPAYLVIEYGDEYYDYNPAKLRKIKCVKEAYNNSDYMPFDFNDSEYEAENIIKENFDAPVFFVYPEYTTEFCMVWTIEGFTEYFNTHLYGGDEENDPVTSEGIFNAYAIGSFDDTNIAGTTLSNLLEKLVKEDEDNSYNFYLNFGTTEAVPVSSRAATRIYKKLTETNSADEEVEE